MGFEANDKEIIQLNLSCFLGIISVDAKGFGCKK